MSRPFPTPSKRRAEDMDIGEDADDAGSKKQPATPNSNNSGSKSGSSQQQQEIISLLDDDDFVHSDAGENAAIRQAMRNSLSSDSVGVVGSGSGSSRAAKRARQSFKASPKGVDDSFGSSAAGSGKSDGAKDDGGIISLLSDSDSDDNHGGTAASAASALATGARKMDVDDSDDDDVVEVVPPAAPVLEQIPAGAGTAGGGAGTTAGRKTTGEEDDDDEIETLGTSNVLRLPHARHDCTQHAFVVDILHKKMIGQTQAARDGLEANKQKCELCYCFVCDGPASECPSWAGNALTAETAHCLAANRGVNASTWTRLRDAKKNPGGSSSSTNNGGDANMAATAALAAILAARSGSSSGRRGASWANASRRLQDRLENLYGSRPGGSQSRAERMLAALAGGDDPLSSSSTSGLGLDTAAKYAIGKGPFKPDDAEAAKSDRLTQCRRCKWRSAFEHRNFTRKQSVYRPGRGSTKMVLSPHKVGEEDWCHACGRIASTKDLGKEQSGIYRPLGTDTCLGTKTIPFTIKSHDPRKLDAFKDNWAEHEDKSPGWKYDAAEMEYDTFRHRIGDRPTLNMILSSIPIVPEDDIPETGKVTNPLNRHSYSYNSCQKHNAANECEAVILESRNDRALFVELDRFRDTMERKNDDYTEIVYGRGTSRSCPVKANIQATWHKAERKGTFTVTLFLCQKAFSSRTDELKNNAPRISMVLGCWFDIFPFTLADLSTGLKPRDSNIERRKEWMRHGSIPIPPYRHKHEHERHELCSKTREEKAALTAYKPAAKSVRDKLSFFSSAGAFGGGISSTDTSLKGALRRFFTEKLIDESATGSNNDRVRTGWIGRKIKIVSHHRDMRKPSASLSRNLHNDAPTFSSYLRDEDHALLVENVGAKTKSIYERTKTFPGLMQHLENLGHKTAPQPEGINVELMGFQKQALSWAIERENTEGGLNSYLWVELPKKAKGVRPGYSHSLWFSPILDMVTNQRPQTARGGFICEQMGLGKTVISLSLVLQNPAPDLPESGTEVNGYKWPPPSKEPSSTPGWNQVVKTNVGAPSTRGSIFSRGTLVVCNVSLVGQWIDEAKSKLKNPGLVYSYHGSSRTRDATILAEKSIVVTTYATLASDNNYHKKKSKDEDAYCSPCEQVRWWRVICDESHVLRQTSGQTRSVLALQAENKWCVTGTPINTNIMDLKNQISFIGLNDHLTSIFGLLSSRMGHHNGGKATGGRRRRHWGTVHEVGPFNFLMRSLLIRHTMEQKCRETNRDLMSLPEKTERVIKIDFSADERAEYDKLEAAAKNAYTRLKNREGTSQLSRHYLRLHSYLLPLRMACSGGPLPEDDPFANDGDDDDDMDANKVHQMQPGDDIECSICLDALNEPVATQCKPHPHIFCKDCITGIIGINDDSSAACPLCRETVVAKKLCKAILPKVKDEDEPAVGGDCKAVFKSKFKRLLSELKKIRDNEPNAKSLIFSQFKSTLDYLKEELPKQGFQFRTLEGSMSMTNRAKALRQFQNDPPTTIFLLSMRAGAVGINLTQANRVFLMEPALNPALEAQAIGRVHRLGQKHKVEVLRLIMTESVETRMLKLSAKKFGTTFGSDDEEDSSGNSSGDEAKKNDGNDADDEDGDDDNRKMAASPASAQKKKKKKPHKDAPGEVATGALRQDKAQMAADEFDLLFGIGEGDEAAAAPAAAAAAAAAAPAGQADAGANSDNSDDDELGDVAI